jgi:Berberine and berberine like
MKRLYMESGLARPMPLRNRWRSFGSSGPISTTRPPRKTTRVVVAALSSTDPSVARVPGMAGSPANHERLARVKARYDPGHFVRFPQSVAPAPPPAGP